MSCSWCIYDWLVRRSEDICTQEEVIIYPWKTEFVKIMINRKTFQHINLSKLWFSGLSNISDSTRSCFAQSWVHTSCDFNNLISEEIFNKIINNEDVIIKYPFTNRWKAQIKILKWIWVLRLFYVNHEKKLVWNDLYEAISNWKLHIDWQYWENWVFKNKNWKFIDIDEKENADSLVLYLTDKKYIPFSTDIVTVKKKIDLPTILWEFVFFKQDKPNFFIWETVNVRLSPNICWVIREWIYENWSFHISSPLIDPDYSDIIRTEIVNPWLKLHDYIELDIYKN